MRESTWCPEIIFQNLAFGVNQQLLTKYLPVIWLYFFSAKEEVKPIWQDSAEKKKQAFTDMYLGAIDKPKGEFATRT